MPPPLPEIYVALTDVTATAWRRTDCHIPGRLSLRAAVLLSALLAVPALPALASPTVVELYQSQGCSSCPPAIANINALASDPQLLVLDFAVTYWDRLGWKDTFARPEYTQRQWDYAHGLKHHNVYTPQVVVAGHL